jgi:hypothetical protein
MIKIDTSDNTVAGFWVVGHEYFVRIEGTTIDGATINSVIGQFSIENRFNEVDVVKWLGQACAAVSVNGVPEVDVTHIGGDAQSATDLKDFADAGYDPSTNKITGTTDMRGTDSAALATTALSNVTWTDAKAAFLDHSVATVDGNVDTILSRVTAAVALASICTETRLAELDAANIPADLDSALADTNELQTDWANGGRLDLLLDACALEATVAALNDISVADIIAGVADGSYDLQEMMRIMFAALSGKSSGGGTVTLKFRDSGDAKDRISATVDATGNRSAVTLDGS